MADFRKGEPVRVAYDAIYYAEPSHRPDEYALVVLPGTVLDGNVLILSRFRAPITALTKVNEEAPGPAAQVSREAVEAAARALVDAGVVPGKTWTDLQPGAKYLWAQRARAALKAAAPHILRAQS